MLITIAQSFFFFFYIYSFARMDTIWKRLWSGLNSIHLPFHCGLAHHCPFWISTTHLMWRPFSLPQVLISLIVWMTLFRFILYTNSFLNINNQNKHFKNEFIFASLTEPKDDYAYKFFIPWLGKITLSLSLFLSLSLYTFIRLLFNGLLLGVSSTMGIFRK